MIKINENDKFCLQQQTQGPLQRNRFGPLKVAELTSIEAVLSLQALLEKKGQLFEL